MTSWSPGTRGRNTRFHNEFVSMVGWFEFRRRRMNSVHFSGSATWIPTAPNVGNVAGGGLRSAEHSESLPNYPYPDRTRSVSIASGLPKRTGQGRPDLTSPNCRQTHFQSAEGLTRITNVV